MKKTKQIKNRITGYLFDSSIYIKDRTFVLFTVCMVAALLFFTIIRFLLDHKAAALYIAIFSALVSFAVVYVLAKKRKLHVAKIVVSLILVLVLRPLGFFANGGIHNGTAMMFLMGAYYLVLVLDGKFRIFMCILDFVIYIVLGAVSYMNPGLVPEVTVKEDYVLSYTQYTVAFLVLTVLITFWTMILKKETSIAEEKSKELDELNKSQNRFFSSMSHEIRTPINTVLGMNELILRQEMLPRRSRRMRETYRVQESFCSHSLMISSMSARSKPERWISFRSITVWLPFCPK